MTHKQYLFSIGMELKIARIRKGLTIKDVSQLAKLHSDCIGSIERGAREAKILSYKRIADALGISMKDFM